MKVRKTIHACAALAMFVWCGSAAAQITPGAVIECLATDNPSHPDSWTNLGTGGSVWLPDTSGTPELGQDEDLIAYYDSNNASWGEGGGTCPEITAKSFSVDIWIRPTSFPTGGENHLFMMRTTSGGEQRAGFWLRHHDDTGLPEAVNKKWVTFELNDSAGHRSFFGANSNSGLNVERIDLPAPLNEWFHVAMAYDDEAKACAVYSNGVKLVTVTGLPQNMTASKPYRNNTLGMLNPPEAISRSFRGHINSIRVYNMVLSDLQVAANFAEGPAKGVLVVPAVPIIQVNVTDIGAVRFSSQEDKTYFLQWTTNAPDWVETGSSIEGTGGDLNLYDPDGFSMQKTYRVIEL